MYRPPPEAILPTGTATILFIVSFCYTSPHNNGQLTDTTKNTNIGDRSMNEYGLMFHHLGLAVTQKDKAVRFVRGLGYELSEEVNDPLQKVNLIMCHSNIFPDIEIIMKSTESGPLDTLFKYRSDLIYHVCFTSQNLDKFLKALDDSGNKVYCFFNPKPAVLFNRKEVSFYIVDGFGLIEIIHINE